MDFPGNDDAERPGWDGRVECTQGTPWIPEGISGWEFGASLDPKVKADGDFAKSVKAVSKVDRDAITFVFVTPRHWPGKSAWILEKQGTKKWRDVRAYDSSDIEQWLESSIAAQAWLANEIGQPNRGVRTMSQCWEDWANVSESPLPVGLFAPAVEQAKKALVARLGSPSETPITITADSNEEALAFLAHFLDTVDDPRLESLRDRALVFDTPGVIKDLAKGTDGFLAVVHSREVERELAPLMKSIPSVVILPRNATNIDADVNLEPLNDTQFRNALEAGGYSRDEIERLAKESGRSLTVLRRRVASAPSLRSPAWASDAKTATSLIPFLWVGAWNASKTADQDVVKAMANIDSFESTERVCQQLSQLSDPPLWLMGEYRGVSSKMDLLFAIANAVTSADLQRFFEVAHFVLGEDDPSLDLPEDHRWAAAIHGKSREFSGGLRRSIAETLVLLAVHGPHLFLERLAFDCESMAQRLVRELLTPLKTRLLEANQGDLMAYAEAAPDEFLRIIESDLKTSHPETYGLLRPVSSSMFGGCPRTGLLWALEGLAWNPTTLPRVALILAQLSQIEISDNWSNRPTNSLGSIFRAWMPQTAASNAVRLQVIQQIMRKFPRVAWNVCIHQMTPGHDTGNYSHKPKWRNDGYGYGEPIPTWGPILEIKREIAQMIVDWKAGYNAEMLCDLVNCLSALSPDHQDAVWRIVRTWSDTASDTDKATIREHIRTRLLSRRRGQKGQEEMFAALSKTAKQICATLEPSDPREKHAWLFREHWVQESADEIVDAALDYQGRDERITALRAEALRDVTATGGLAAAIDLADRGNASSAVGFILAQRVLKPSQVADAVVMALKPCEGGKEFNRRMLVSGLIGGVSEPIATDTLLDDLRARLSPEAYVTVLLCAPFGKRVWQRVDALEQRSQHSYWSSVSPNWIRDVDETVEAIERLILAKRPRAAFNSAHMELGKLDPELLFRLMSEVGRGGEEQPGHFHLDEYYIEGAFKRINASTEVTLEQKAGLEYMYLTVLSKPAMRNGRYGIPNLEKFIHLHPELYVQAIVHTYKRSDDGTDPAGYAVSKEDSTRLAEQGYRLLDGLEVIPGRNDNGEIVFTSLLEWVNAVRSACEGLSRLKIADVKIGELLAHAPSDANGVWPCEPVRDLLEEIRSGDMMHGAYVGRFNLRGVHWRGEGGAQERELADIYRGWAESLQYTHPYVSSELLLEMARMYERDARREDTEAYVRRRLY